MGLIEPGRFEFVFVVDFPLLEYSEEDGRFYAVQHPFTKAIDEDIPLLDTDPASARSTQYDLVCNGSEQSGGSIRLNTPEAQKKMLNILGFSDEDALDRFGHMVEAFRYGAPPHGGCAFGFDRLVMRLAGTDSIRDVIAFPKVQSASELMTGAPGRVDGEQLKELGIKLI
jgi:aspartyl-tRNA synthetase